jgi:Glyoxalase-like domain
VSHRSQVHAVVIDVAADDHDRELEFWRSASGEPLPRLDYPEYHGSRLGQQHFALLIQHLGEGVSRIHLDLYSDDVEAEVARLERLGAERVEKLNPWQVMRDPAGLLFCVVPAPPGSLTEDNSRAWD